MKKILFMKTVVLAACLSARASGPSVAITTSFTMSGDTAVTCKTAPEGDFTATPEFEPDDKVEIKIDGPQFQWTIAPAENVSLSPTDAPKVTVRLADNAFGKYYDVGVIVTWIVWDKIILDFRIITATDSMTLAAFTVALDAVEGADYIGKTDVSGTLYYATSRKDGDAVIIKLKTIPAVDYIFIPAVTWSGGAEGVNQMERVVSRSTLCEQGVYVSASAGFDTVFSGKIYVFRAKPGETECNIEKEETQDNSVCDEDDWGKTNFDGAKTPEIEAVIYYENMNWKFVLQKVSYELKWGIASQNRTDLPASAVNDVPFPLGMDKPISSTDKERKTCAKSDLAPISIIGKPTRDFYWSSCLSDKHENFHMNDFHEHYYSMEMQNAKTYFESTAKWVKVGLATLTPQFFLDRAIKDIEDKIFELYELNAWQNYTYGYRHETAAFGDGKSSYQELVDSIIILE